MDSLREHALPPPGEAPASPLRDRRVVAWFLSLTVVALGGFAIGSLFELGPELARTILYYVALLAAASACLLRAALIDEERGAWLAVGIGVLGWTFADIVYVAVLEPSGSIPYPSIADALYLSFYPACFVAIALFARDRRLGLRLSMDALIGTLAVATIWAVVLPGSLWDSDESTAAIATNLVYPLLDLLLVALTIIVVTNCHWRVGRGNWLFLSALLVLAVGDTIYVVQVGLGTYSSGTVVDVMWPAGMCLLALSAWSPIPDRRVDRPMGGYLFPLACTLIALGVLIWDHFERAGLLTLLLASGVVLGSTIRAGMLYVMREAASREAREALRSTVRALALAVDAKDAYTAYHSDRVTLYALAIGIELGLPSDRLERLCTAAQLHDVGKLAIPDGILLKPSRLTAAEFEVMKGHSAAGERIVRSAGMREVAVLIRHHHERHDGRGYPDGLRDDDVPLESRIIALADSLDAMTSQRSYSDSMTARQAIEEIASAAGKQFDPDIAATTVGLLDRGRICPELAVPADLDGLVANLPNDAWVAELRRALLDRSAAHHLGPQHDPTPEALASF